MNGKNYSIMLADPPWGGPTARLLSGPDVEFNDGRKHGPMDEAFVFTLDVEVDADPSKFPPLDFTDASRHPLFSHRLVRLLADLSVDNIDYYDARVTYSPTAQLVEYRVANIVGVIDGLDRAASLLIEDDGIIFGIEAIVFDESRFGDALMFRLRENTSLVVAHDSIRKAIEDQGLTGFLFVRDDEWKPGMI